MLMLVTEYPNFCAECGSEQKSDKHSKEDFHSGCSFTCQGCGTQFQKLDDKMAKVLSNKDLLDENVDI